MTDLKALCEKILKDAKTATERPFKVRGDSIYDSRKNLVCNMTDLFPVNGNRNLIVTSVNSAECLAKAVVVLNDALENSQACIEMVHKSIDLLVSGKASLGGFHTYEEEVALQLHSLRIGLKYREALAKANEIARGK